MPVKDNWANGQTVNASDLNELGGAVNALEAAESAWDDITGKPAVIAAGADQAAARAAIGTLSTDEITDLIAAAVAEATAPGLTYYVSPDGSNGNSGLSTDSAFATPAAALAVAPAGSSVLLERGGVWGSEVTISTNRILLDAYGTGNLPVIDRGTEPTGSVFNDGFEAETSAFTTNWNGKTEASSSTVTLETTNPVRGSQSLKYTHAASGTAYVTKTVTAIGDVYVQFKVKLDNLVTGDAWGTSCVLNLRSAGGSNPVQMYIGHDDNPKRGVQVRFDGAFGSITSPTYYQQGQTLRIEIRYNKNTGVSGWVNGNSIGATDVGAHTIDVTTIRLGNAVNGGTGLGAGTILLFDDVKVGATAIGVGTRGDNGITVDTANDVTVQNVEVRNADQSCIKLRNGQRTTVRNCKLHDSTRHGIIAAIGGGSHTIENNEVWFTGGDVAALGEGSAIQFLNTTTGVNTVRYNNIHHVLDVIGDHGIYSEGGANIIAYNRFYGISGFGVKFNEGSAGSTVMRNRIEFCRGGAIFVNNDTSTVVDEVNVYHNSAYNCGVYPWGLSPFVNYWVGGYGRARLVNNIGGGEGPLYGIEVDTNADLLESDNNAIQNAANFGYWKGADKASIANWRTASSLDTNSITSDPLYTDPDAGDLTLQSGSPAKNAGKAIAGVNDGYSGAAPDLGYAEADA